MRQRVRGGVVTLTNIKTVFDRKGRARPSDGEAVPTTEGLRRAHHNPQRAAASPISTGRPVG